MNIGDKAFSQCEALTSIDIPDSITSIGEGAFENCKSLIFFQIPNSVIFIGNSAFKECTKLTNINLNDGVTTIGEETFIFCDSLTSIYIPNSVTSIGKSAFWGCKSLTSIIIPIGTRKKYEDLLPDYKDILVEQELFYNSSTEITDEDMTNAWIDDFGFSYSKDKTKLLYGPTEIYSAYDIKEYAIHQGTKVICNRAFDRGVADSLNYSNIEIPNTITHIGDFAFGYQNYIETITIPNSVVSIGKNPFVGCRNLEEVICLSNRFVVHNNILYSISINSLQEEKIISFWGNKSSLNVKKGVKEICDNAFENSSLKIIKFPDSIQRIGKFAFDECSSLEHIIVPIGELSRFKKMLPKHMQNKLLEDIDSDGFPFVV